MRRGKDNYYLDVAQAISIRASCVRRKFGAIIVNNDKIVSCGYNGAPRGKGDCCDLGVCVRNDLGVAHGQRYELCRSVHAEANAIIHSARESMIGGCLYLVGLETKNLNYVIKTEPCIMCKRLIINSGIGRVIIRENMDNFTLLQVEDWTLNDISINI